MYGFNGQWSYRRGGFKSKRHTFAGKWFDVSARIANQEYAFCCNMFRLAEASGEFIDRTDVKQVGRPLLVPEKVTIEEFLAEFGRKIEDE